MQTERKEGESCVIPYCRVSHRDSVDQDNSIPGQMGTGDDWTSRNIRPGGKAAGCIPSPLGWRGKNMRTGSYTDGPHFIDEGTSAYKQEFLSRPAGAILWKHVRPGDHVIFAFHDRAFRLARDGILALDQWVKKGITMHFLNTGVAIGPNTTSADMMSTQMILVVAEFLAAQAAERIQETKKYHRDLGVPLCGGGVQGWVRDGTDAAGKPIYSHDSNEREEMIFVAYKRLQGYSNRQTSRLACAQFATGHGEARGRKGPSKKRWGRRRVELAYVNVMNGAVRDGLHNWGRIPVGDTSFREAQEVLLDVVEQQKRASTTEVARRMNWDVIRVKVANFLVKDAKKRWGIDAWLDI